MKETMESTWSKFQQELQDGANDEEMLLCTTSECTNEEMTEEQREEQFRLGWVGVSMYEHICSNCFDLIKEER
jgi:hypothetical protein